MNNVLIIAPHADDELIGCWSVIAHNKGCRINVHHTYEITEERDQEAVNAAWDLGFTITFDSIHSEPILHQLVTGYYDEVYVPSRRDWHADHQAVNRKYRKYATKFYSVDMARGIKLPDAEAKLEALNRLYPSQKKLWANNDKYWLFEDISDKDYDEYRMLAWTQPSGFVIEVTTLAQYTEWVLNEWYPSTRLIAGQFDKDAIDRLLSHCSGLVIIKDRSGIKEAQ